jgi:hypothetical protein
MTILLLEQSTEMGPIRKTTRVGDIGHGSIRIRQQPVSILDSNLTKIKGRTLAQADLEQTFQKILKMMPVHSTFAPGHQAGLGQIKT